ncbi:UDP-2,4-diacetamido-2,4,6-trideoxy-beta-L-altropyranose hydrolase [Thalassotalea sp. G2M2-11]|uniref:UDP-2,4-diacetamido-2,4, 6-trideoxy-beta-L-altropyranose hydrolase n=1 Tax=Thalassotalea sp. G2M2-11 TaxID=2787627 RepID=UPI0019D13586|nr:UDP-2,4-diacetamido-2,4,6-trideoxy-beta-L-altropyranose hydrolase [Thalassotalea sp. G2M2-11]
MNCHLLFRFDANADIGFGHAMRCLAVIEALLSSNVGISVLAKALPQFLQASLKQKQVQLIHLPAESTKTDELAYCAKLIKQLGGKLIFLDGYQFDQDYRQQLAQLPVKIATFDDLNELEDLHADFIINAMPAADQLGYQLSAQGEGLFGLTYSVLRKEFLTIDTKSLADKTHLLINFGGSDIGSLTLLVLQKLVISAPRELLASVVVVTGAGCKNTNEIDELTKQYGMKHIHQCQHMAQLLNNTRLALTAPGAIVYELAYCRVPSVFLIVAENQVLSAKCHQNYGWCDVFDGREIKQVNVAVDRVLTLWQSFDELEGMYNKTESLVDGKGAERIAQSIMGV